MRKFLNDIEKKALSSEGLTKDEAERFSEISEAEIFDVLPITKKIREHFKGIEVNLCGIVNAKSGLCKEDCSFCSQSVNYSTGVKEYPMVEPSVMVESAITAEKIGAREFSIVTSGTKV
ncbi:MAG: biotin synthase BioB, partial [Thermodesulfobacteriota bacterium]